MFRRRIQPSDSLRNTDDNALARALSERGDARAFAALVDRWQGPIQRLCARMLGGDRLLAEDMTQEVFVRIFEKRRNYTAKAGARFSTYLWRVAINRCRDEIRRRERRGGNACSDNPDVPDAGERDTPDAVASTNEEAEIVRRALGKLPESYRSVLVLRHYEGLRLREIAEVLEIPEGTVYSRMAEALRRMGDLLRPAIGSPAASNTPKPTATSSLPNAHPRVSTGTISP